MTTQPYRMVRRWWRDWCIGWHQGAIQRHTRLLAKYDPERERREYAAYLATSPAHVRSACWDGACPISTVHWKREPGCIRLTDVTGNAQSFASCEPLCIRGEHTENCVRNREQP